MKENGSLFKYELAVVAILKNEATYIAEWIDYHRLAGVDHFYLYDNDSSDNLRGVLSPYIECGIVEYSPLSGRCAQVAAYNDALDKHRFDCLYMGFLDADEFIVPRGARSITDVLHELLDPNPIAGGLTINWHMFGSGGQEKADFTRGVLDRFLYRQPKVHNHVKTIANPRLVHSVVNAHFAVYFDGTSAIDENGKIVSGHVNALDTIRKIGINHYYFKSREEFLSKIARGTGDRTPTRAVGEIDEDMRRTDLVLDDEIVRYREARREYSPREVSDKLLAEALIATLTPALINNTPREFFDGRLHEFLTCRALSRRLSNSVLKPSNAELFEETALECVFGSMASGSIELRQAQLFLRELPTLLSLKYPVVDKLKDISRKMLRSLMERCRLQENWRQYRDYEYHLRLLEL